MISFTKHQTNFMRTVMLLLAVFTTLTALATDFITDVMLIGSDDKEEINSMMNVYENLGWTVIDNDLNAGCGEKSDYIYLLYKTTASPNNSGKPITGFYIYTGDNSPISLTYGGLTYVSLPYTGSESFINSFGDLNHNAGGEYIYLYYTQDVAPGHPNVTGITFNDIQDGAIGANGDPTGYDLNHGCGIGTKYIYMHVATFSVTLTSESADVELPDGIMLTGTGGANTHVTIADGATVTLSGVDITGITFDQSHKWAGITCLGDAVIILDEGTTNSVKGGYTSSGIFVPKGKTLTIQGSGILNATGNSYSAGIGGSYNGTCGHITICSGTINATGEGGAGIGSGRGEGGAGSGRDYRASCGIITISGGTVTANGGNHAAGIGSGSESQCGNITISGGTVTATGGKEGAGIGSGYFGYCDNVTISGGTVTAKGGEDGAGIGSGYDGYCDNVTITTSITRVTATKGTYVLYSIGKGYDDANSYIRENSHCGIVTIGGIETGFIKQSPFTYDPTVNVAYTLSFDANGGTGTAMENMSSLYGLQKVLPDCTYRRTGYEFAGWSTTASGAVEYANRATISTPTITNGAVTLYAKWTENVLELTDNASNATTIATAYATHKTYNRVTLAGRTLYRDGDWNTLCLPFGLTDEQVTAQLAPAKLMTLSSSSFSGGTLTLNFADATSIDAGKPYIVKWASGDNLVNPTFTGVDIRNYTDNVKTDYVDFIGITSPVPFTANDRSILYLGAQDKLYYPGKDMTLGACRAYFQLKGISMSDISETRIFFEEEDRPTITEVREVKEVKDDRWYDLQGRKLEEKPTKAGLYINGNKKVIVK